MKPARIVINIAGRLLQAENKWDEKSLIYLNDYVKGLPLGRSPRVNFKSLSEPLQQAVMSAMDQVGMEKAFKIIEMFGLDCHHPDRWVRILEGSLNRLCLLCRTTMVTLAPKNVPLA